MTLASLRSLTRTVATLLKTALVLLAVSAFCVAALLTISLAMAGLR
ncbi:hypothetical protein [Nonomuraea sp. NPDC050310]